LRYRPKNPLPASSAHHRARKPDLPVALQLAKIVRHIPAFRGEAFAPVTNAPRRRSSGRKRHILTDTLGLLLAINVHSASLQDRDGAEALLREARRNFPR
jgi:putative transposase